jgi:hypothetical protein
MAKRRKDSPEPEAEAEAPDTEDAETEQAAAAEPPMPVLAAVGLMLLVGIAFALPTILVAAAGMAPSLVVALMPKNESGARVAPVAIINLAGVASVLGTLWRTDHSIADALAVLSSSVSWLVILGSVVIGLAVRAVFPNVGASLMERAA